jgi:hypothetical protein
MSRAEFTIETLRADGEPTAPPRALGWPDAYSALALVWPAPLSELGHYFELARAAPGHPVDACAIVADELRFSARITYRGGKADGTQTQTAAREAQQTHRSLREALT